MSEKNKDLSYTEGSEEDSISSKELFRAPLVIEEFEEDGKVFYGVGIEWPDGSKRGLAVEEMQDVALGIAQLGLYIRKEGLGWQPSKIATPKSKLILPGQ
jgi:hypothetical protein